MLRADVFCRVIDNYGDIGVTYRLIRQLCREHDWSIRLWVDQLASFKKLEPLVDYRVARQSINGIDVIRWDDRAPDLDPADVTIASFSCDLPASYLAKLHASKSLWINLDYLSAEDWVEGCHGLPSLRSDGLSSYFFFPGFTEKTGGLIREENLISQRDHWWTDRNEQFNLLCALGIDQNTSLAWRDQTANQPFIVSLFCYPQANVTGLINALATRTQPSLLLVPDGVATHLQSGRQGQFQIQRIPFVTQPDYDKILWTADLNFVRGEDSLVRAIWAGKPMIWQIYPQDEGTHFIKLDAWIKKVTPGDRVTELLRAWNGHGDAAELEESVNLALSPESFARWRKAMFEFCTQQTRTPDLASALIKFCELSASTSQKG
jgi:uncharacterized repeat protein (TIGR03837 family)